MSVAAANGDVVYASRSDARHEPAGDAPALAPTGETNIDGGHARVDIGRGGNGGNQRLIPGAAGDLQGRLLRGGVPRQPDEAPEQGPAHLTGTG